MSNPTLANLVIVSSSLLFGLTISIGVLRFSKIVPTQGAKLPFKPIKIEPGIWAFENSSLVLTSRINALNSFNMISN